MSDMIMFLSLWFFSLGISSDVSEEIYLNKTIEEYRVYALSKCIWDNYEKIGVDFKHTSVSDFTEGFIDMDMGFGFNVEPNNLLNRFIESKVGHFYLPKQLDGDLAFINLITYDCTEFYNSDELKRFLRAQIIMRVQ